MAYDQSRRYCKVCDATTVHWQDHKRLGGPDGSFRERLRRLLGFARFRWRCVVCDNPWHETLITDLPTRARGAPREDRSPGDPRDGGSGWTIRPSAL